MSQAAGCFADVIVVGGGNAALCAALSAAQNGADVIVLESAGEDETGGNSWFSDGAMRFAFDSFARLRQLLRLPDDEAAKTEVSPYSAAAYFDDLRAAGGDKEDLMRVLADDSFSVMMWLRDNGVKLELITDNQSYDIGGRRRFFGNLNVRTAGRGIGLVNALRAACQKAGVKMHYQTPARKLHIQKGKCAGVIAESGGAECLFRARAVVLACGGFEADDNMRACHLGEQWRKAKVRGSCHNRGEGLRMALDIGAARAGSWQSCHAVGTDYNAPAAGDFSLPGDIWKKHSYPYGIVINRRGLRFLDEGADLRNYTYAKYGREVLRQPGAVAWQLFDDQSAPLLRSEYLHDKVAVCRADAPAQLAARLDMDDDGRARLLQTLQEYNRACQSSDAIAFNPAVKDGKSARGLAVPKSNWALPLCRPPFLAFAITCGITFTFGGVDVDVGARVLDTDGAPIDGLFAAGEMVGGIFGHNYPGGSGLMSGAVFGKIAGRMAANAAAV